MIEDLRITLNRKKKSIHPRSCEEWTARGQNQTGLLFWAEQFRATPLFCLLFLSCLLDFPMFSLVKPRSSPSSGKWKIPGFPRGFGLALKFVGDAGEERAAHTARQGQARRGRAGVSCSVLGVKFHLLNKRRQLRSTRAERRRLRSTRGPCCRNSEALVGICC